MKIHFIKSASKYFEGAGKTKGASMTIGDVLGVVFGVIGIGLSGWATLVGLAVLFARRSRRAQDALQEKPGRVLARGALIILSAGALILFLINQPHGLGKLIGYLGIIALLGVTALGASGLAELIGSRLQHFGEESAASAHQTPSLSRGAHAMRGAGLLMAACGMPFIGWLTVLPFVFLASLGAGATALRSMKSKSAAAMPPADDQSRVTSAGMPQSTLMVPAAANRWESAITNSEAPQ